MKKGLKIAIGIATIGVVGVGGYFLFTKVIKPRMGGNKNTDGNNDTDLDTQNNNIQNSNVSSSKVPFKNTAEGNAFRGWVNDNYPSYAKSLFGDGLDRTGGFDNKYTRDAWGRYGNEYQKAIKNAKVSAEAKANRLKVGDYVLPTPSNAERTAYNGNPINNNVASLKYAIPKGIKYKIVKMGKDAQNGKSMSYIFSSADKGSGLFTSFPKGRGFQIYTSYLKKTTF